MKILIVGTGKNPSPYVLERVGQWMYMTVSVEKPENVFTYLAEESFDAVVFESLSGNATKKDAAFILSLRKKYSEIPCLLIVKREEDALYVQGMLDAGVDICIKGDYLKEEFEIRLQKLVEKRNHILFSGTKILIKDTLLDLKEHAVSVSGKDVHLTKTEYGILLHLCLHKNIVVKNNELVSCLRGGDLTRSLYLVNVHIHNLRRKLKGGSWIKTVPHYGFMVLD